MTEKSNDKTIKLTNDPKNSNSINFALPTKNYLAGTINDAIPTRSLLSEKPKPEAKPTPQPPVETVKPKDSDN